ncbi:MAG TPA: hypothetical protein VMW38_29285 [Terriglobia bacterium]|nr:hypothetical protein [Terriglobia bacterium]
MHTVRAARRRGKSVAGQLAKGACERATQVILGIGVTTGKARAAPTQQLRDGRYGYSLSQQLLSDPLVGNTPIGVRKSLWNPQPLQPSLIDVAGRRGGTRCGDHPFAGERTWQRSGSGDGGGASYLSLGGLDQQRAVGSQPNLRLHDLHPGGVSVALTPEGFLISEPGQPSQMTPVGAGQVATIDKGQPSGDGGGYGRFQADRTDLNPGLEVAGAGLEHHARLMAIGTHQFECGRVGVVQIQQDVPGIPVVSIRLNVHVTAFTIANAQESYRRLLAQLGGRPESFAWECSSGGVVNQSNQIEIMRHRRELSSNAAQREEQATIKHKCCRRSDSPYNALMVRPRGRKTKQLAANRECQNSGLSQKRAQPRC